jgi:hypothetical protein
MAFPDQDFPVQARVEGKGSTALAGDAAARAEPVADQPLPFFPIGNTFIFPFYKASTCFSTRLEPLLL